MFKIYQQTSSYAGGDSANSMSNGVGSHSIDGPRVMGTVGSEPVAARSRTIGFGGVRPEVPLPPEASSTLFVEGLPAHCTRREVSRILLYCFSHFTILVTILVLSLTLVCRYISTIRRFQRS